MIKTNGGFLITKIKQMQGRVFEHMLDEAGIREFNGSQGRILYVLWQHDNMPIAELSRQTGLAKNTLTSMLDRMETEGHICRKADPKDRRKTLIQLTDKAKEWKTKYQLVSDEMSELFYTGFNDTEIIAFEESLKKILNNLEGK